MSVNTGLKMGVSTKHISVISLSNEKQATQNDNPIVKVSGSDSGKSNLYYSMKPLFRLQSLFAMQRTPTYGWKHSIHCALMGSVLIVWTGVILRQSFINKNHHQPSVIIIDIVSLITHLLTSLGNLSVSMFQPRSEFTRFSIKTKKLGAAIGFDNFETYKTGRKLINKLITIVFLSLIFLFSVDAYSSSMILTKYQIILHSIYYLFYLMNSLVFIHFVMWMFFIKWTFLTINLYLVQSYEKKGPEKNILFNEMNYDDDNNLLEFIFPWKKIIATTLQRIELLVDKQDIDSLMEAYMVNSEQCQFTNGFFKIQNLLITINGTVSVIRSLFCATNFYGISKEMAEGSEEYSQNTLMLSNFLPVVIRGCFFVLYDIMTLISLTAACEMVVSEAKKTSQILNYMSTKDDKDGNILQTLATIAARRIPHFTACRLFTIDFTLLSSMAATVAAYFVILMQLNTVSEK